MMRNWTQLILIALLPFVLSSSLLAASDKPLTQILSYQEWTELLSWNATRMPELAPFWRLSKDIKTPLYWTGSSMRGFLHWHFLKLQKYTPAEIRSMSPPSLKECQSIAGKDIDLSGNEMARSAVLKALSTLPEIDFIDEVTFSHLTEIGGPTLEKVRFQPYNILDEDAGLLSYYRGELAFKNVPQKEFERIVEDAGSDYSKTVEAVRFIRFLIEYFELHPTAQSVRDIRTIAGSEIDFLNSHSEQRDYVMLAASKLLRASAGDINLVIHLLSSFNLLHVLSSAGIYSEGLPHLDDLVRSGKINVSDLTESDIADLHTILDRRNKSGFTSVKRCEAIFF